MKRLINCISLVLVFAMVLPLCSCKKDNVRDRRRDDDDSEYDDDRDDDDDDDDDPVIVKEHDNPLQYSCLEKPMDRGAWRVIVHMVTKSWT